MKKLFSLFILLLSVQVSASNFDVTYRFDSTVSDDYFTIRVDFDYVAPGPVFFFEEEVFDYEQFIDVILAGDNSPIFFFETQLIDTNMSLQLGSTGFGYTSADGDNSLRNVIELNGSNFFLATELSIDILNFPTGWEPGQTFVDVFSTEQATFVLTEITQVPLPAALPLLGMSLLILARRKAPGKNIA